jgi:hypothetical protein
MGVTAFRALLHTATVKQERRSVTSDEDTAPIPPGTKESLYNEAMALWVIRSHRSLNSLPA